MDRASREGRRATNGLSTLSSSRRHRHRTATSTPLDEEMELRLRDRASLKKDHHHNRERERFVMSSRNNNTISSSSSSSKRRRAAERLSKNNGGEEDDDDEDDDSTPEDESVSNDEEDEERIQRKNFLPISHPLPHHRVFRAVDEFIGVSVPRKARSVSTKRAHETWSSAGFSSSPGPGGEQIHPQASASPIRQTSPSSSNVSVRKKMKPNGATKPKLPKASTKAAPIATPSPAAAAAQDEIEIEIAEVLYGLMRQPQKQENSANIDSREAKSMASSPISNSQSVVYKSSAVLQPMTSSPAVAVSVIAPKRKKPREVKYNDENSSFFAVRRSPISSSPKAEMDQPTKTEALSSNSEKNTRSTAESGAVSCSLAASTPPSAVAEAVKAEREAVVCESKPSRSEETEKKKESHELSVDAVVDDDDDKKNITAIKESVVESKKEEKFQIDLMVTPSSRSSPEGEVEGNGFGDEKAMVIDVSAQDDKPLTKEDERAVTSNKENISEAKKAKTSSQDEAAAESKKSANRERNIDLQLDLEKTVKDGGSTVSNHLQKNDKNGQSSSLPFPVSVAGWPGGLPPMGYMPPPFQGVVPMDGNVVPSAALQPPQMAFTRPRPPRCATHCYIARNICYHQQFTKMNPFLPAVGSASLYGAKACNLNVVPPSELHGNSQCRVLTPQENGQPLGFFPGKDKISQAANITDAQRKQILLQQPLPPGPAFIIPLSQQQAASAAGQQGNAKFVPTTGTAAASSTPNSTSVTAVTTGPATAPVMNFNFPPVPSNEAQYLAVLPNNAYPFPIPGHVGATAYRGNHSQPMPFFSGSFYSSQMLHPSQFQQQQPPSAQSQQNQQHHQSTSTSSSSSQKNVANQQGHHGSGVNNCGGSSQGFPAPKTQTAQQQQQSQLLTHQSHQLGTQMGGENSTSAESRPSRSNMSVYNQNFPVSFLPTNFSLITPASVSGGSSVTITSGNQGEQKQQPHQQGSQAFTMSFASINGATAAPTGIDLSSIAQNHAFLQSLPEATRQSYQIMAAAAAAAQATQQKKNYSIPGEVKGGVASSNMDEKRESTAGKPPATGSQAIAFSRSDDIYSSVSSMPASSVIDSSARTMNLGSTPAQSSACATNASVTQQQLQRNNTSLSLQQQYMQLQKQQQYAAAAASAAARSRTPAPNSGIVYSDHHSSPSSMVTKIPSALSGFPANLVQNSSSSSQSQLKNSGRTSVSRVSSPPMSSSMAAALKNLPHQQSRIQQSHTQISFSANPKSSAQGQQAPSSNPSPPPHMVMGSPTTSSVSKSSGGSPLTTAASSVNKLTQASALSVQGKNSPSVQNQKSAPVGGRSLQSCFGNSQFSSSNSGPKPQFPQQQPLPKQTQQQHQLFFSTAYMPGQAQQPTSSNLSANSGYYLQRRQSEQPQKTQQLQGSSSSSSGILPPCPPVTLSNASTSDPPKAVASAPSNIKGAGLPHQGFIPAAQFAVAQSSGNPQLPAGFSYIQSIQAPVNVKPTEQKQPAGE